jgi:hypothetical protein
MTQAHASVVLENMGHISCKLLVGEDLKDN